jgi:hypothetical protein
MEGEMKTRELEIAQFEAKIATRDSLIEELAKENAEMLEALEKMVEYVYTIESIPCINEAMKVIGGAMTVIKKAKGDI